MPPFSISHPASQSEPQPIRVLVVENCAEPSNLLSVLFSHDYFASYRVDWELNYAAGCDAAQRGEHDVAIFDHRLGGRTGLELLRALGGESCGIPIILLLDHDDMEIEQAAFAAGAADCLTKKDLRAPELARAIRHALWHARLVAALDETQGRLEHFLQNSPCAAAIESVDGQILHQNDLFHRHFSTRPFGHFHPGEAMVEPWFWAGDNHHWLVHSFPLSNFGAGEERGIAALDVTAQVATEDKLKRTALLLKTLLANLPVIVGRIDEEGRVTDAQGNGPAPAALVGRILSEAYPAGRHEITHALHGGTSNLIFPAPDGEEEGRRELYVAFDNESGSGAVFLVYDVAPRRTAGGLAEAPRRLTEPR